MSRPVIAVDIDDVLYPTAQHLADTVGARFGVSIDAYKSGSHRLGEVLATRIGIGAEEAARLVREAFLHESIAEMQPFAEAHAAIKRLAERYSIVASTARSTESHDVTRKVIKRDFGGMIEAVYFPNTYEWTEKLVFIDKIPQLKELGATWLIDDKLDHLYPLADTGIRGGLFGDYPWNQHPALPSAVVRLSDWDAVINALVKEK